MSKASHFKNSLFFRAPDHPSFAHVPSLSYGSKKTGNLIILGDNLHALNLLRETHERTVKCVYLDPPYNNKESYNHYEDDHDSETWLSELSRRLRALVPLLREDGSVWISIDDREAHYLKVRADEVFGRDKFVATIVWNQRTTRENRRAFSPNHEYIFVYAINPKLFTATRNLLPPSAELLKRFKNPDNDPRGPWQSVSANVQAGHATQAQFYEITAPNGRRHHPPKGRCWVHNQQRMLEEIRRNNVWFGKDGNGVPRLKRFLSQKVPGLAPHTIWPAHEVDTTDAAKKHLLRIFPKQEVFDTPKPEALIHRILHIATNVGDLVLDPYLGSGTTAAVAHKMGRKYIGIERGNHAITHCAQRLRAAVCGDAGGVLNQVGWKGGGGFDFFSIVRA
jgi:adenine-specific DNA-methyltransferase